MTTEMFTAPGPWLVDPRHGLVVIVLTQRMFETSAPPRVHREIQDAAYAALP